MTTVLLDARTMMLRSCCLWWVCWYQSRVTSVSWVGIRVTCKAEGDCEARRGGRRRRRAYLQVGAPLSFAVQQSVQDPAAGLAAAAVVAAHHVVGRPHPLEELLVHVLGTAVIGHVGQVHVHRGAWGRGHHLLVAVTWKAGQGRQTTLLRKPRPTARGCRETG